LSVLLKLDILLLVKQKLLVRASALVNLKSAKRQSSYQCLFAVLRCACAKAALKTFEKLTQGLGGIEASHTTDHRCFGPSLCCSPTEGCFAPESAETAICAFEDNDPNPCKNDAPSCYSAGPDAQCVTEGLCCNPKGKHFMTSSSKSFSYISILIL